MSKTQRTIQLALPIIIFIIALAVSLHYNFATRFLTKYDGAKAWELYTRYRLIPIWHLDIGATTLQNTGLLDTYVPGVIQHFTHLPAEIFYKVYLAIGIASVPVVVYFIGRKLGGIGMGVTAAVYTGSWVCFYQGGSFSRLNFAVLFFGLTILLWMSDVSQWKKIALTVPLGILITLSHYGTAGIAILGIAGGLVLMTWFNQRRSKTVISVMLVGLAVIIGSSAVWQVEINREAWKYYNQMLQESMSINQSENVSVANVTADIANIQTRDKITQAAFGVLNPDGDSSWTLNRWLLISAWLALMLILYGIWKEWRQRDKDEKTTLHFSLALMSLASLVVVVLAAPVSRGYGLEKVFYQASVLLAPCYWIGSDDIGKRLKVSPWVIAIIFMLPYTMLMYRYGVIPSVIG